MAAWGRQAEVANEYLAKGRQVYVDGRLRLEEYTDREGNLRLSAEVNASDIHFLGQRGVESDGGVEEDDDSHSNHSDEHMGAGRTAKSGPPKTGKKSGTRRGSSKGEEEFASIDEIPF